MSPPSFKKIIIAFISLPIILITSFSLIDILSPFPRLNENQILYLFSTCAQVIAGIYGLTITGFIFLRNELSREENEDETLIDAIDILKKRYFQLLLFVSIMVAISVFLSIFVISYESTSRHLINSLFMNSAIALFITSLLLISFFIFDVTSPSRIRFASQSIQDEIDPNIKEIGNLEDFLRNYNEIEMLLNDANSDAIIWTTGLLPSRYISEDNVSFKRQNRRTSNSRLAEILYKNEKIDHSLYNEIKELVPLRNSIVHGAEPIVSKKIVELSATVLAKLKKTLTKT